MRRLLPDRVWRFLRWFYGWPAVRLLALLALPIVLVDIGPAYTAHSGTGRPGVFVAARSENGRTTSWYGDFFPDDGEAPRRDVLMASGGGITAVGDRVPALDAGNRAAVYPPDGGWDWLFVTIFLVVVVAILLHWTASVAFGRRRRRGPPLET